MPAIAHAALLQHARHAAQLAGYRHHGVLAARDAQALATVGQARLITLASAAHRASPPATLVWDGNAATLLAALARHATPDALLVLYAADEALAQHAAELVVQAGYRAVYHVSATVPALGA